jgi:hypothetical protein
MPGFQVFVSQVADADIEPGGSPGASPPGGFRVCLRILPCLTGFSGPWHGGSGNAGELQPIED